MQQKINKFKVFILINIIGYKIPCLYNNNKNNDSCPAYFTTENHKMM